MSKQAKSLTLFGFFAITASMVMTVYEYPTFATSGFHLVFFLLLGGFLWFLPVALCAAEMATVDGWQEGGIFFLGGKYTRGTFWFCRNLLSVVSNNGRIRDNDLLYSRCAILCI